MGDITNTVGIGGDGRGTFNVSTALATVAVGAGGGAYKRGP